MAKATRESISQFVQSAATVEVAAASAAQTMGSAHQQKVIAEMHKNMSELCNLNYDAVKAQRLAEKIEKEHMDNSEARRRERQQLGATLSALSDTDVTKAHVAEEKENAWAARAAMISKACDMLGMGGVPIKEKNNKVKLEALKVISKLDFDKLTADEHDEVLSKKIQTALISVVKANIYNLWALAPVVKAISEIGANGLDIPHVHEMRITAEIAAEMKASIIKGGTPKPTSELMRRVNILRLKVDYGIACDMSTKGWIVMKEDDIIDEFNEMSIEAYALANSLLSGWMEGEAGMSKLVTAICAIQGRECGEKDRKLTIKSKSNDAVSIFRVMLLETEVYGVHAMDDASDAVRHGAGCFLFDNWRAGVSLINKQLQRADDLNVELSYSQTVYGWMGRLKEHRNDTYTMWMRTGQIQLRNNHLR